MTAPRRMPMEPTTFAVCRRVHDRRFALRPDSALTSLVVWLLGLFLPRFGVELHAATVMSTHYHLVVTASEQRLSDLMERLNATLAKAVNVLRKSRRGILWTPGELSIVELKTERAMVFQIAYAIVNPVASGLVWDPEDWPGLCVRVDQMHGGVGELRGTRPGFFFRTARWAETSVVRVTLPPPLLALGEDVARDLIRREVERQLAEAQLKIRAKRFRVLGPVAARNVSPYRRAKTGEEFGALNPRLAAGPGEHEALKAAIEEYVSFQLEYRAAWKRYKAGEVGVVFPYGTLRMRMRFRVRVAEPPT